MTPQTEKSDSALLRALIGEAERRGENVDISIFWDARAHVWTVVIWSEGQPSRDLEWKDASLREALRFALRAWGSSDL